MANVTVITGTPGVGKSTLGRGMAKRLGANFADISELVKKEKLYGARDSERGSYLIDERRVRRRIENLVYGKIGWVIATHSLAGIIPRRSIRVVLVLRFDPQRLYRRLRRKGWTKRKSWENVESEIVDVCFFEAARFVGGKKVFEIDTTGRSKSQVLDEALKIIRGKAKMPVRRVNWLKAYDPIVLMRRNGWRSDF